MHPLKSLLTLLDDNFNYLPLGEPQPRCCVEPLRVVAYFVATLLVSVLFTVGSIFQLIVVQSLEGQLTTSIFFGLADAFCYITLLDLVLKILFYLLQSYRHYKKMSYVRPVLQELFEPIRYSNDHNLRCYAIVVFHSIVTVVHSLTFGYLILVNGQPKAYLSFVTVSMFMMVYEQVLSSVEV